MSNEETSPRRFDVFTIREYEHQKQIKSEWIRIGVAFETKKRQPPCSPFRSPSSQSQNRAGGTVHLSSPSP